MAILAFRKRVTKQLTSAELRKFRMDCAEFIDASGLQLSGKPGEDGDVVYATAAVEHEHIFSAYLAAYTMALGFDEHGERWARWLGFMPPKACEHCRAVLRQGASGGAVTDKNGPERDAARQQFARELAGVLPPGSHNLNQLLDALAVFVRATMRPETTTNTEAMHHLVDLVGERAPAAVDSRALVDVSARAFTAAGEAWESTARSLASLLGTGSPGGTALLDLVQRMAEKGKHFVAHPDEPRRPPECMGCSYGRFGNHAPECPAHALYRNRSHPDASRGVRDLGVTAVADVRDDGPPAAEPEAWLLSPHGVGPRASRGRPPRPTWAYASESDARAVADANGRKVVHYVPASRLESIQVALHEANTARLESSNLAAAYARTLDAAKAMLDRPAERRLWAHCVSAHSAILSPEATLAELEEFHQHEHEGPGTIRNHDVADRSYSLRKIGEVLSESDREDG